MKRLRELLADKWHLTIEEFKGNVYATISKEDVSSLRSSSGRSIIEALEKLNENVKKLPFFTQGKE